MCQKAFVFPFKTEANSFCHAIITAKMCRKGLQISSLFHTSWRGIAYREVFFPAHWLDADSRQWIQQVNETWWVLVSGSIMTSFGWMTETGGQWGLLKYTPGSLLRSDPRSTHLLYIFNSAQQIRSKPELTHEEILSHLTEHMWPAVGFKGFRLASCHACKKTRFPLLFHLRQVIERTLYVVAMRSDRIPFSRCKLHLYRFGLFS